MVKSIHSEAGRINYLICLSLLNCSPLAVALMWSACYAIDDTIWQLYVLPRYTNSRQSNLLNVVSLARPSADDVACILMNHKRCLRHQGWWLRSDHIELESRHVAVAYCSSWNPHNSGLVGIWSYSICAPWMAWRLCTCSMCRMDPRPYMCKLMSWNTQQNTRS